MNQTAMTEPKLIDVFQSHDERGCFIKPYSGQPALGGGLEVHEICYSRSRKNVLRGMHFQTPPHACAKLVRAARGAIRDVVVDLRRDSPRYGACSEFILREDTPTALYVPVGFAHGFLSLEEDSLVLYCTTAGYDRDSDAGIRWDSIGVAWGVESPILSERDRALPPLNEFISPF